MGQQTVKSSKTTSAIVLGSLTLLICVIFDQIAGSKNLFQMLALTVICTAGIGGLVIGFVVFLVGMVEMIALEAIMKLFTGEEQKNKPVLEEYSINPAVLHYVLQAKKRSFSKEKISANLLHAGWELKIVEHALSLY